MGISLSNLKIGTKLYVGFMVVLGIFAIATTYQVLEIGRLGRLQDEGATRARDAVEINDVKIRVGEFYTVIADAVINRDLAQSGRDFQQIKETASKDMVTIRELADTAAERASAEEFVSRYNQYLALFETKMLPMLERDADMEEIRALDGEIDSIRVATFAPLDEIEVALEQEMAESDQLYDSTSQRVILLAIIVTAVGVVAALAIAIVIARAISNPLNKVVERLKRVAKGDLSSDDLKVKSKDEIGDLADSLNEMSANLNEMVGQVASATTQIASSTQQLSATSEEMAAGAEEQTSQTSQVATSVEEMSATVQEVAKNAKNASDSSSEAGKTAEEGGEIVGQTVSEMQKIAKSVSDLQDVIQGLNKNSEKIGDIVGVIDDVADQTNLLALNAAIEAARAGEQGRGFAVVADEVRKLAERTTSSTKEIADMVKSIQGDTSQAVSSMEEAGKEVKEGVEVAGKAGDALKKIVEMSQGVNQIVQQIATAAEQQAAASEEISSNVESIASVSKQSASGAQQTSSAAQELSSLADGLQSLVNQFKLRDNGSKAEAKVERRASIKKEEVAPVEQVKVAKVKAQVKVAKAKKKKAA